jgi:hypothetical protein
MSGSTGKRALSVFGAALVAAGAYYIYRRVAVKLAWDEEREAEDSERKIESYEAYSEGALGPKHNGKRSRNRAKQPS